MQSSNTSYLPSVILGSAVVFFGYDVLTDVIEKSDTITHIIVELLVFSATSYVLFRELQHVKVLQNSVEQEKSKSARMVGEMLQVMLNQFVQWQLTPAETEVALLLLKGLSMKEIASVRDTKEKTIRLQASSIYTKSGYAGRHELAAHFMIDLLCAADNK